ncbi:MAG: Mov34/MPN/PAD-1 family protein [Phycisphaerales bacterium]|nr:Mov34/MPN/PAD-1 family protein [Phycisphaerales bacterium]
MGPAGTPSGDLEFKADRSPFAVRLTGRALAQLVSTCIIAGRDETGGVLIGRYSPDHRTAIIEIATGPGGDSRAGRAWLIRGVKGLQRLLNSLWSSGGGYYLGEWHFHPGAAPTPSHQDVSQMKVIASSPRYHCPEPVLVILGGEPGGDYLLHVEVFGLAGRRVPLTQVDR